MINFLKAWAVSLFVNAVFYGVLRLVDAPEKIVVGFMVGAFIAGVAYSLIYAIVIYKDIRNLRW